MESTCDQVPSAVGCGMTARFRSLKLAASLQAVLPVVQRLYTALILYMVRDWEGSSRTVMQVRSI